MLEYIHHSNIECIVFHGQYGSILTFSKVALVFISLNQRVEFNSKFYEGRGKQFSPLSFIEMYKDKKKEGVEAL